MMRSLPTRTEPPMHVALSFEEFFEANRRSLYGACAW